MSGAAFEANFDGLVGPTHNYAGLSRGNRASEAHGGAVSDPRAAALQGLAKMRALAARGLVQGILPPHERPHMPTLRRLGFAGSDAEMLAAAARADPHLLPRIASASAMWAANAATVCPSADAADGRVHITPASLTTMPQRALEAPQTARLLRAIFPEGPSFAHHPPLPALPYLGDEGAANHLRLAPRHGAPGLQLFAFGRDWGDAPGTVPARQSRAASASVARLNGVAEDRVRFVRQSARSIAAGAFHLDVVAVANEGVLLRHASAFEAPLGLPDWVTDLVVSEAEVSLEEAVRAYLFNAQLVTRPEGGMLLIVPQEALEVPATAAWLARLDPVDGPIQEVQAFDLRQSMRNGGGPACLRLRVVLTPGELASVTRAFLPDAAGLTALEAWVRRHYRDRLAADDLRDPALLEESRTALDALTGLLGTGSLYEFQGGSPT